MNVKSILGMVAVFVASGSASAGELLTNGNFETGTFAGWTTFNQTGGSGSMSLDTPGTTTPLSAHATATNPMGGGSFYAVTDQTGPGTHGITQAFNVTPGSTVNVSFDLFINNWDGALYDNGLNYSISPNENGRVDILTAGAGSFSTSPADIVMNLVPPSGIVTGNPHTYTHYNFNISGAVASGGTFQIRFAESDNQGYFNLGVDNVSIVQTPEPASLAVLGLGAVTMLARRKRCR